MMLTLDQYLVDVIQPRMLARLVDSASGCHEWSGARSPAGYGRLAFQYAGARHWFATHRLAWMLSRGPIPKGAHVLHRCDNPPCCNPEHLFVGTALDNVHDMIRKGRWSIEPLRKFLRKQTAARTHCSHGHPYSGDNLVHGKRGRECRECQRAKCRKQRARKVSEC